MSSYILDQSRPSANTNTLVYTVAAGEKLAATSIYIAVVNSNSGDFYSIAVVPSGDTLSDENWIVSAQPINNNAQFNSGLTLPAGTEIYVKSQLGLCSFTICGIQSNSSD